MRRLKTLTMTSKEQNRLLVLLLLVPLVLDIKQFSGSSKSRRTSLSKLRLCGRRSLVKKAVENLSNGCGKVKKRLKGQIRCQTVKMAYSNATTEEPTQAPGLIVESPNDRGLDVLCANQDPVLRSYFNFLTVSDPRDAQKWKGTSVYRLHSDLKIETYNNTVTRTEYLSLDSHYKLLHLHYMFSSRSRAEGESGYLVSAGGTFRKAVWVANRDNPLFDKFGILIIDEVGSLKVSHGGGSPFVLCSPARTASNVSATLLDSGNFISRELCSTKRILWQSFDYPTDTLLPGMKLGINFKTGHNWSLSSWISDAVPATGSFTLGVDPSGASQWIISWKGKPYWTSGLWRNRDKHFDLAPELSKESDHHFSYTENEEEKYFFSTNKNHSMSGYSITSSGEILERSKAAPFRSCGLYRSNNLPTGCIQPTAHKCTFMIAMPIALAIILVSHLLMMTEPPVATSGAED
ncbi:hypothetical protein Gotur_028438 [Gossypium turneri]